MKIGVDMGHTVSGADYGSVGILKESECTREIGKHLKSFLSSLQHEIIDCTVDMANSVEESLSKRVGIANDNNLDLYISIHLNSGGGQGVETYIVSYGGKAAEYANKVQNKLAGLGYVNRGIKVANLYVLKYTIAPAILAECGFVDSEEDSHRYNAYNIAKAIAEGITGQQVVDEKKYYVATNYLSPAWEGYAGIDINSILNTYFTGTKVYLRSDVKGIWIETEYMDYNKAIEVKEKLGALFFTIKED